MDVNQNLNQELERAAAIYDMLVEFFVKYSFQILGAIIILIIGLVVARKIGNAVLRLCERKGIDVTLSRFIASTVRLSIVVIVGTIVLGKLGISVTPLIAAIGALSLGAGLAVQGLLSNYGAGFNIILTRPFVVGDTISVEGVTGQVYEVNLATTVLINEDGVRITIPNRHIVGEIIHNSFTNTLAELSIGIAYHEDPDTAISVIEKQIKQIGGYDESKTPKIGIESFGDSSINIGIRVWIPTQEYYDSRYKINNAILAALKDNAISIPFPQQEVRLLGNNHRDSEAGRS